MYENKWKKNWIELHLFGTLYINLISNYKYWK